MIVSKGYQTYLVFPGFLCGSDFFFLACEFCSSWPQWNALGIMHGYWKELKGILMSFTTWKPSLLVRGKLQRFPSE